MREKRGYAAGGARDASGIAERWMIAAAGSDAIVVTWVSGAAGTGLRTVRLPTDATQTAQGAFEVCVSGCV
jgi:hypothetical protein